MHRIVFSGRPKYELSKEFASRNDRYHEWLGRDMETEWYNRAEAIQQRITQLRDSL
jgi:hypothetical protein